MITRAHIFYAGIVQGVGFRYTVQSYAQDLKLTGWVKNLKDGRVELLVEGSKETIEQLMKNIEEHFLSNIRYKNLDYFDPDGRLNDFTIVF